MEKTERGGLIYTATLLLFITLSLLGKAILRVSGATGTVLYAVNSLFSVTAFSVATFFYVKKNGKTPYMHRCSPVYILPALLLAFGMILGLGFVNTVVADAVKNAGGSVAQSNLPLDTPMQYILFTVLLCVFPAISEEMFFRGVLLDCLSETGRTVRVLTVALCFSLYHGNAAQLCYQFIYGVGLALLTLKANRLIPPVIAHFINNFAVISVEFFAIPLNLFNPLIIIIGAILLLIFALFIAFFGKEKKLEQQQYKSVKGFYLPLGILGIGFSVLLIILSAMPV